MNPDPRFKVGEYVQRVSQPESSGIVREHRWDTQAEGWNYLVQFGTQLRALPEEAIENISVAQSPWDSLQQGALSGRTHFVCTLTYERLKNPPARIAHSFATARTQFYPHQFKPLLKFLDNPGKAILIADDVGLGKTIEAAYILRELDAHQAIERVLIIVPARLRSKWEKELQNRFDEHFKVVKGIDLADQANRLAKGREPESFRWITSFESTRSEEIRAALDEMPLPIDVLIVDEAHRLRNPDTLQHKVGTILSRAANAVVFLTATPVQNKLEDLWNLLKLLSPEEFSEWSLFQEQIKGNRLILSAQEALARHPPNFVEAQRELEAFVKLFPPARSGRSFVSSVFQRLDEASIGRRECLELQSDISRMSPTGHLISRTRKVEAIPNRAKRDPHWQLVKLTSQEREIYENVEEICRRNWSGAQESWGFQMSLIMAYRMTASCIPAAVSYFSERFKESNRRLEEPFDEIEDPALAEGLAEWTGNTGTILREIVDKVPTVPQEDSKLKNLHSSLLAIWEEDDARGIPRRKIVVFSFFTRTLDYLSTALTSLGVLNRTIHGKISIEKRERSIDDFLERNDIPVLLTSEVGGEGIDLQAASVLFNYDLPWNPMVVEQRIGRIDRIGQKAKRLVIVNFVVKDSIEERVLKRLLTKIEIFRESIGEPDPIIGEQIERLAGRALQGELSDDELEKEIEQQGDALARRIIEAKKMLKRVDGLLAADQLLIDEINAIIGERQLPSEHELILFLNSFLADEYPGTQLPQRVTRDVVSVSLGSRLGFAIESASVELGHEAALFGRRISTGSIDLTLSRDAGFRHPRSELIHLQHPLTRFVVREKSRKQDARNSAFGLSLKTSRLPSGHYVFLVALLHINGLKSQTRLVALFTERNGLRVWSDPEETTPLLIEILERSSDPKQFAETNGLIRAKERLLDSLYRFEREWENREQKLESARTEQQAAARLAILDFRVQRVLDRLRNLELRGANEFAVRMTKAQLGKAEEERAVFKAHSFTSSRVQVEHEEIAVGILDVESEAHNGG